MLKLQYVATGFLRRRRCVKKESSRGKPVVSGQWCALLLFVLGAAWGLQLTLLKATTYASLSEPGILSISLILLAVGFGAALVMRRLWFRPNARHVRFFMISGLFGYVLPLGGVLLIAERLAAGLIVLYTEALIPVFTIVISVMLRTERLTARRSAAVVLAMSGVVVTLWPELVLSADARLDSLWLALMIPLAYAIDGVYISTHWPRDLSPLQIVTGEAVAGAVLLAPVWLLFDGDIQVPVSMGQGEWAIVAFVLVSYLEVYLYFYLLKTSGAVLVAYGCFVSLLAGFGWGVLLLGEQYRASVPVAVGLIMLGLYLIVTWQGHRA